MTAGTAAIHMERVVRAPLERVFRAFVEPSEAVQWWGPPDVRTSVVEIDLRAGGVCRWVMHPQGGTAVLHGRIVAVESPRLLVMTNRWEDQPAETPDTLLTLRFTAVPEGTRVELTHERLGAPERPGEFEAGWRLALDSLEAHLARA